MSETAEDRAFYAAVEAAFIRRRGTPFLLSPSDFALLREWRSLGVPLEAVEAGIDEAFTRREERKAVGRVNSLSYCRDAVLGAWERRAETSRGKGAEGAAADVDTKAALEALALALEATRGRRPDLDGPIAASLASVARLQASSGTAEEIEGALARWTGNWQKNFTPRCPRRSARSSTATWPRSFRARPPGWIRPRSRRRRRR